MIPKFKIGEKFTRKTNPQYWHTVKTIIIKADSIYYCNEAYPEESFTENEIAKYIEPKPKVKKYLYAYSNNGDTFISGTYYKSDEDFAKTRMYSFAQRLDWSMIEVDSND